MLLGSLTIEATPAVQALFPDVPVVDGKVTLEHTPRSTIPLRAIGFDVPSSIRTTYDWNGGTPFDIQVRTCEVMTENPRCFVLNSMGTGKTRCALWAFDYMKKLGLVNKMLVVCPLSTMTFTWGREVLLATPHLRWNVLYGSAEKRRKLLADPKIDVHIINHDGLAVVRKEIAARTDIDVLCLDELAVYRNPTRRTKIVEKIAATKTVVWGMTGAPMPNYVTDIYNQIKVVTPHRMLVRFTHLRDELMYRITQFKWVNKVGAIEKAFNYFQPAVRYTLDDITELPEAIVPPPLSTELGPQQRRIYDELRKYATTKIASGEINAANAGVVMGKLLQVSAGWLYDSKHQTHALDGEARLDALTDIIDAASNKVIVFCNHHHVMFGVHEFLKAKGYEPHLVYGDTPPNQRNEIFTTFQMTSHPGPLVAHPRCLSHGLTLTAADTIVWFGPPTSAETYDQANARIRRVGQKHKQLFVHLSSTPIERAVYKLLTDRIMQQDSFLHLLEEASWD
jgi:SNF2 family DNA or RNA helicase